MILRNVILRFLKKDGIPKSDQQLFHESNSLISFWESAHASSRSWWTSGTNWDHIKAVFQIESSLEGKSLLVIGVGQGQELVSALKDGAKVSGLDISSNARDLFKNLGDMYDWETLKGTYDLIIMHLVAQHMSDKSLNSSLEKLTRHLKPGGILKIQFAGLLNGKYDAGNHEESEVNMKSSKLILYLLSGTFRNLAYKRCHVH